MFCETYFLPLVKTYNGTRTKLCRVYEPALLREVKTHRNSDANRRPDSPRTRGIARTTMKDPHDYPATVLASSERSRSFSDGSQAWNDEPPIINRPPARPSTQTARGPRTENLASRGRHSSETKNGNSVGKKRSELTSLQQKAAESDLAKNQGQVQTRKNRSENYPRHRFFIEALTAVSTTGKRPFVFAEREYHSIIYTQFHSTFSHHFETWPWKEIVALVC